MLKMKVSQLPQLFALMAKEGDVYLPIKGEKEVVFSRWSEGSVYAKDECNTQRSPKDFFFPQSETLMGFKTEGKNLSVEDLRQESDPFVVFGVRACDVKSMEVLDRVFLAEPVDTYYAQRREKGTIVAVACGTPESTCFCSVFGIDAAEPAGDVSVWFVGEELYWQANTAKGEALSEKLSAVLQQSTQEEQAALNQTKEEIRAIMKKLPYADLSLEGFNGEALQEKFDAPEWASLSEACIGCGTCTFVCPTCQCYDIRDYDTGHGILRYRCWDSCMYSDFTKMAHGNPRLTQVERFRQRFMHKLIYFPANHDGMYSCVGCGRCLQKCPISMNIVKVIKTLGGKKHD